MADVVKKHSISSELAQKMVGAAVAKARELGVSENVAILDDGGNLMAFSRMDGAPILSIEMAQNKAYTALFGVSTQDFFIAHFMFPFGRRLPPTLNFAAIFQCFRRSATAYEQKKFSEYRGDIRGAATEITGRLQEQQPKLAG
jgi:hypothetical protein